MVNDEACHNQENQHHDSPSKHHASVIPLVRRRRRSRSSKRMRSTWWWWYSHHCFTVNRWSISVTRIISSRLKSGVWASMSGELRGRVRCTIEGSAHCISIAKRINMGNISWTKKHGLGSCLLLRSLTPSFSFIVPQKFRWERLASSNTQKLVIFRLVFALVASFTSHLSTKTQGYDDCPFMNLPFGRLPVSSRPGLGCALLSPRASSKL